MGSLIGSFKTVSTKKINALQGTPAKVFWQRNYYEHVVRDDYDLLRIREYIASNPRRWHLDRENPEKTGEDEFDLWLDSITNRPDAVPSSDGSETHRL